MKLDLEEQVMEEILQDYEKLYRLAYTYVKNEQDALDIVQDSVYKAIRDIHKIRNSQYTRTWIWRIVVNTSLDCLKKRKITYVDLQEHHLITEDTYSDFDTIESLDVLSDRERTIIVLRFFEEFKIDEIASILGEKIGTVKSCLYRSLKKLKNEMNGGEFDERS